MERWRDVVGYEGLYKVSDYGNVLSLYTHRVLKPSYGTTGYPHVWLYKEGRPRSADVHVLVLEAFRGPCPAGMEALHGSPDRKDARLEHLSWGTRKQNQGADRVRDGTIPRGVKHGRSKLTDAQAEEIRALAKARTLPQREIAAMFEVTQATVSGIKLGKWREYKG